MQDSDSKAGAGEGLDGERERNNSVPALRAAMEAV